MGAQAVIEITRDPDGGLPAKLILEAYRASAHGVVVLVLREISPPAIDRILDDLVLQMPLGTPGVIYVDADDELSVLDLGRGADVIFAATDKFRALVSAPAIDPSVVRPLDHALGFMSRRGRQPASEESDKERVLESGLAI